MSNYYNVLKVDTNATLEEIRQAYRRLALRWHPDKNADNTKEANQRFREICEAYQILSDPEKRKTYDEQLDGDVEVMECPCCFSRPQFVFQTFETVHTDCFQVPNIGVTISDDFADWNLEDSFGNPCHNNFEFCSACRSHNYGFCSCEEMNQSYSVLCNSCSYNSYDIYECNCDFTFNVNGIESNEFVINENQNFVNISSDGSEIILNAETIYEEHSE